MQLRPLTHSTPAGVTPLPAGILRYFCLVNSVSKKLKSFVLTLGKVGISMGHFWALASDLGFLTQVSVRARKGTQDTAATPNCFYEIVVCDDQVHA